MMATLERLRRLVGGWLVTVALMGAVMGCQTLRGPPPTLPPAASLGHDGEPRLAFVYHPYGPALDRRQATPHPDYQGWTDTRMRLDTQRMRRAGAQLVFVALQPAEVLAQPDRRERFQRFLAFADQADLQVVWYLPSGTGHHLAALTDWLLALSLERAPAYRQVEGRPVIATADAVSWVHPGIGTEVWVTAPNPAWAQIPGLATARQVSARRAIWLAVAGVPPAGQSLARARRQYARDLADTLAAARLAAPAWVIVESWNDYATGNFVEPNSLDQDDFLRHLEQGWQHAGQPPAVAPAAPIAIGTQRP